MQIKVKKIKEAFRKVGLLGVIKLAYERIRFGYIGKIQERIQKQKQELILEQRTIGSSKSGFYHAYKIGRFLLRYIGIICFLPKIIKNRKSKTLIILHFYYIKAIDEVVEYLKNIKCYNFDLVVTYVDPNIDQRIFKKFRKIKPNAKFVLYPNKGYEVGSFISIINQTNLKKYDIILNMHTKSSNKRAFIYDQFFCDRDWFSNLWNGVLGSFSVHKTIDKLYKKQKYGIVAAKNLIVRDPAHKEEIVTQAVQNRPNIQIQPQYKFVAGNCFAIKAECLKSIQNANISIRSFEATKYGFFSFAHIMERVICASIMPKYEFYGNRVDYIRKIKWKKLEAKLREMSALQLTKLPDIRLSPDFVWHTLEGRFLKKYLIEAIKIKDIRRKYFDGTIKKIEECEPFLYLKGDKNIYKKYERYHKTHNLPIMTTKRFDSLIDSIKTKGYDESYPIIINGEDNTVWDGQHRACVLLDLFGPNYKTKVIKVFPAIIDLATVKPFSDDVRVI